MPLQVNPAGQILQTRLLVAVGADTSYHVWAQTNIAVHCRSDVAVAAFDAHWSSVHTSAEAHVRSSVSVLALVSYS